MSAGDQSPFTQELPVFVRLRGGHSAVVEQLRQECGEFTLCGRFLVGPDHSRTVGTKPNTLWRTYGTFATDHAAHELDIVAEIMPDLSERPLATDQVEYHPFLGQRTLLEACRAEGMALTAYCPLARGRVFQDPTLARIAQRHGKTAGQVALRWLVQQEGVVAIPRSSRVEHARANFQIFDFALSEPEMAEIDALSSPQGRIVAVGASAPAWDSA